MALLLNYKMISIVLKYPVAHNLDNIFCWSSWIIMTIIFWWICGSSISNLCNIKSKPEVYFSCHWLIEQLGHLYKDNLFLPSLWICGWLNCGWNLGMEFIYIFLFNVPLLVSSNLEFFFFVYLLIVAIFYWVYFYWSHAHCLHGLNVSHRISIDTFIFLCVMSCCSCLCISWLYDDFLALFS